MTNTNQNAPYTEETVTNNYGIERIKKILFVILIIVVLGVIVKTYALTTKSPLQMCQESYMKSVNEIYKANEETAKECTEKYGKDIYKLNKCTSSPLPIPENKCGVPLNGTGAIAPVPPSGVPLNGTGAIAPVPPSGPTLREQFGLKDCRFVNEDHRMGKYNLQWTAYDIACEKGIAFDVKSPGDYKIERIGHGANIGDYIILKNDGDFRIVIGHTQTSRKKGERLKRGDIIGQTNLSGLSTGMHVHIELWYKYFILSSPAIYGGEHYRENQWGLLKHRNWDFGQPKEAPYYFTAYNLGDVNQNDATPCIGASGNDLCYLESKGIRTMALTSDIRAKLGIKFGDTVQLEGDAGCEGKYSVQDEMNIRFSQDPGVLRPGTPYYIKGDLPSKPGGACYITKL